MEKTAFYLKSLVEKSKIIFRVDGSMSKIFFCHSKNFETDWNCEFDTISIARFEALMPTAIDVLTNLLIATKLFLFFYQLTLTQKHFCKS